MVNALWDNLFKKDKKEQELISCLKNNYLFENLNTKEINFISNMVHVRHYQAGEPVFKQGELGVGMYIISKGKVDITIENPLAQSDPNSASRFITRLQHGDFFGEISLVEENERRTASAVCCEETTLVGFFKPGLNEIISRNPATGVKIMTRLSEVLGRRLRETTDKVSELKKELQHSNLPSQGAL